MRNPYATEYSEVCRISVNCLELRDLAFAQLWVSTMLAVTRPSSLLHYWRNGERIARLSPSSRLSPNGNLLQEGSHCYRLTAHS